MISKLSRKKAHRENTIRNLLTSLILYESVKTTIVKSKVLKSEINKLIKKSSENDLSAKKYTYGVLFDKKASKKVFEQLIPRYKNRSNGFVKVLKLGKRLGDNAELALVELEGKKTFNEIPTVQKDNIKG